MKGEGWGRIVNVGSTTTIEINPALGLSNAHRLATVGFLKTLAREVAGDGITVNTVATGRFATDRMAELGGSIEQVEAAAREEVPAGRLGTVEEYGDLVAFLCSERRRLHHRHRDPDRRRPHALDLAAWSGKTLSASPSTSRGEIPHLLRADARAGAPISSTGYAPPASPSAAAT